MGDYSSLVEYVTFDIEQMPQEIKKSQELKEYILLHTQGYSVELIESPKTALCMFACNVMNQLSPEVVLVTNSGEKWIIYDHQNEGIIRPEGRNPALAIKEAFHATNEKSEVTINLEDIWKSAEGTDFVTRVKDSLKKVKEMISFTQKTTIIGNVPLFLTLAAQHLVGNNTQQLFYMRNADSNPQRVK